MHPQRVCGLLDRAQRARTSSKHRAKRGRGGRAGDPKNRNRSDTPASFLKSRTALRGQRIVLITVAILAQGTTSEHDEALLHIITSSIPHGVSFSVSGEALASSLWLSGVFDSKLEHRRETGKFSEAMKIEWGNLFYKGCVGVVPYVMKVHGNVSASQTAIDFLSMCMSLVYYALVAGATYSCIDLPCCSDQKFHKGCETQSRLASAGYIDSIRILGVCIGTLGVLDSAYLRAPLGKTCGATSGSGSLTLCILGGSRCQRMGRYPRRSSESGLLL